MVKLILGCLVCAGYAIATVGIIAAMIWAMTAMGAF